MVGLQARRVLGYLLIALAPSLALAPLCHENSQPSTCAPLRNFPLHNVRSLPTLTLDAQHLLRCRPHQLALNCDSSKLGVVDFGGTFSILDMHVS